MARRALYWSLAALWLALALPHIGTRYSFNWDSSQFERGVRHFDIARHQPQPPGYPLWIVALRALTVITGRVNASQVLLALLFTIAALLFFASLARSLLGDDAGFGAAALLAFSPLVCLCAITPLNYAVDLFASCSIGWMALRLWRGEARWAPAACALAAATAGFRPSGVMFLLPLLGVALWRARRGGRMYVVAGIAAGAVAGLAWFIPTALVSGGFQALAALDHAQLMHSLRETSIFFGAPFGVHAHMIVDACLYLALGITGVAPLMWWWHESRGWSVDGARLLLGLWLIPNLLFILLLHCGEPGYVILSLPALVLVGVHITEPAVARMPWTIAAVAVSLAAGYFPYERLIDPAVPTVPYQLLRATPRMAGLLESSQRQLAALIDTLPGPPNAKLIYCLRGRTEAPNIRTVTEEYADVYWAAWDDGRLRVFAPHGGVVSGRVPDSVRVVGWLCDGAGLPADLRAQYPEARQAAGNQLYSLWSSK